MPLRRSEETDAELEARLTKEAALIAARRSPGRFMTLTNPRLHYAHHTQVIDDAITRCVNTPEGRLIVSVTVRAGKSVLGSRYTPAWYLGNNPDRNVILAGHEATFAAEHGGFARDLLTEWGPSVFGVTVNPRSRSRSRWTIAGAGGKPRGGMLTLGVGGSPIGRGADLMIVDDPIKNWEVALNDDRRRAINETWWQGVMESRIEPGGSVIVICSRWHEDDLSGWLLRHYPAQWDELHIPALAEDGDDALGRAPGESFWPRRWPKARLEERRERTGGANGMVWLAQYMNRPTAPGGKIFPVGKLRFVRRPTDTVVRWCRGWDLAATDDETADYSATVLLGQYANGRWLIAHAWRDRLEAHQRNAKMVAQRERDGTRVQIELPQDPAQAGKDQAQQLVAMLAPSPVFAKIQSGSKVTRALGLAAQVQAGNVDVLNMSDDEFDLWWAGVVLPDADDDSYPDPAPGWLVDYVAELRAFDTGVHDDWVDASSSAFNGIAGQTLVASGSADDAFAALGLG